MATMALESDFDIVHRSRIKTHAPDPLARLHTAGADNTGVDDDLPVGIIEYFRENTENT